MGREKHKPPFNDPTEHSWSEWANALNKLPPSVIDFSGGEPTIFPKFTDLINELNTKHALALSTNLQDSSGFKRLIEKCHPKHFVSVTCSWHKTGKLSWLEFLDRTLMMRKRGFPVTINIVRHPLYRLTPLRKDWFILKIFTLFNLGAVNVSPFENPKEIHRTNKMLICNAGVTTFTITPEGNVYRCLTWFRSPWRKEAYQGNIFDDDFEPLRKEEPCDLSCEIFYILNPKHSKTNMFSTYVRELP